MQQASQTTVLDGVERKRVETVVETLAALQGHGESVAEVAHDARNMVTALGLYCDLLEEPGVLAPPFHHYGDELRLVATASRRLVEKLVALDAQGLSPDQSGNRCNGSQANWPPDPALDNGHIHAASRRAKSGNPRAWELPPPMPIENMAAEVEANRNLLAALAGPSISLKFQCEGGVLPVLMTGEDLTRVLVNLVKNASEAMPSGGQILLGLHEFHTSLQSNPWVVLTVEDSGPGIQAKSLDAVFEPGFSTHRKETSSNSGWASAHRGLGLSISRSIVEAAGGRIHAANHAPSGARFEIELPVRSR
jgi:signal transduction histidine kinase